MSWKEAPGLGKERGVRHENQGPGVGAEPAAATSTRRALARRCACTLPGGRAQGRRVMEERPLLGVQERNRGSSVFLTILFPAPRPMAGHLPSTSARLSAHAWDRKTMPQEVPMQTDTHRRYGLPTEPARRCTEPRGTLGCQLLPKRVSRADSWKRSRHSIRSTAK